jgi:putative methionine-R-sulfoxide reductase with GAF domain
MPNYEVSVFVNTDNEYLTLQAVAGNEQELTNRRIAFGKGVIGEVALYKKAIKINDTFNDERYVFLSPNNRSELAVPILFGDRLYGVLNVEAKEAAAFDETDLEIMVTLGANLASTLSVIELIYQINTQAAHQRQMFEAANKIRQSPNMQSVLETSVNEISKMLGAYSTKIKVFLPNEKETAQPENNNGHNGRNGHGDN